MAAICEAVGKQMLFFHLWNQVFGKQSAFWWSGWSKCKGVKAAGTVVWCFVHILQGLIITARMWGYADLAKWGHAIVFNASTPAFIHESSKTHTHTRRHKHSHDVYLSVAEQFLCQSSADTDRQYGVEDACHKREKPEWNDRLSRHPSPPLPPSLTLPKHLTHSSLDCYDKPDTCQSCTHRQDGEDSSIHRSTC